MKTAEPPSPNECVPGSYSPGFVRVFAWYTRRLMRSKFHAVRIAQGTSSVLASLNQEPAPVIVLMNHASWWDPLVALFVGSALCPARSACGPIDIEMLRKFGFFRKLGLFGIDPESPGSVRTMVDYVRERFQKDDRATLWITPQGRFADVRAPLEIRPGAAMIAARTQGVRVLSLAIEYPFWLDQKPEVCVRLAEIACAADSKTTDWQRAMAQGMRDNAHTLAELVIAREPSAFETLGAVQGARTNPVYDWWLRVRGKTGELRDRTRTGTAGQGTSHA
jgi:hypothetical protein